MKFIIDRKVMTCGWVNVLLNVSFQPVKSILLITTNYFSSTESRNLERTYDEVKLMQAFVLWRSIQFGIALKKRKIFGFIEY